MQTGNRKIEIVQGEGAVKGETYVTVRTWHKFVMRK